MLWIKGLAQGCLVVALLWALAQQRGLGKRLLLPLAALLAMIGLAWNGSILFNNFREPKEWDFLAYYLYGKVAAAGLNVYDVGTYPGVLSQLTLPYAIDQEFRETVLGVGFDYVPPTVLLHYPLGFFDYTTAHLLWVVFCVATMAGSGVLIYRMFLRGRGAGGILAATALFLLFPAVRYGVHFEQTSIVMLLPYLLFWRDRDRDRAGVWATLAVCVKPLGAFLGLYLLLRRRWRALGVSVAVFALLCLAVGLVSGFDVVLAAFNPHRFSNVPESQFSEFVNQSLLAEIIRLTGPSPWGGPLTHPLFLILGSLLFAVAAYAIARLPKEREALALAVLLPLSLIVYPGTLNHYSLLLLPVLFWMGLETDKQAWKSWLLVGAVYALIPPGAGIWAHLLLFAVLVGRAWKDGFKVQSQTA